MYIKCEMCQENYDDTGRGLCIDCDVKEQKSSEEDYKEHDNILVEYAKKKDLDGVSIKTD